MDQALMLRIRERAYHIWTANGGDADQNWLLAETEIINNLAAQAPKAEPKKKQPIALRRKAKNTASAGLGMTHQARQRAAEAPLP